MKNSKDETASNTLNINTVAPGLFAANANGRGVAAAVVCRRNAAGQESYEPAARSIRRSEASSPSRLICARLMTKSS